MGYSNETFPRMFYPSLIGRPMMRFDDTNEGTGNIVLKVYCAGDHLFVRNICLEKMLQN